MSYTLTKANVLAGIQCHKRLWHEVNQPSSAPQISPDQQRIIGQGQEVGVYARQQFPHGVLIGGHGDQAIKETESAIASAAPCLFEAAFCYGNLLIRADILQRHPDNTWSLIEVKSSTKPKDEHLLDVAIQYYVLTRAGLTIRDAALMVINNQDCFFPDLSNLFTLIDVTDQVILRSEHLPDRLQHFHEMLAGQEPPEQPIGQHCSTPNPCPFQEGCWHHVPPISIFTIPRLSWDKKHDLIQQSRLALTDLPATLKLTANQQAYVDTVLCNQPQFDYAGIASSLAELTYPIHFFDFETLNPAIPRFDGLKPFEQFPFQYSCHILQSNGTLEHHDYLHTDRTDPRRLLVEALTCHIAPAGSVVVYHKSFESKLLRDLAQIFPEYAEALLSINDRLWDQEDIFKHYYRHPAFLGKTSIKKVLPIVVPGLSYEGLDVQNGAVAQAIWDDMINTQDLVHKQQLIDSLKEYCTQDTLAMVKIHNALLVL